MGGRKLVNASMPRRDSHERGRQVFGQQPLTQEVICDSMTDHVATPPPLGGPRLVAWVTLRYNGITTWANAIAVSCDFVQILYIPWRYARSVPRDGLMLQNTLCTTCGWWSGNAEADLPLCDDCSNSSVCFRCSYRSPVDGVLRCAACKPRYCDPPYFHAFNNILDLSCDQIDALQMAGGYSWGRRSAVLGRSAGCCFLLLPVRRIFSTWRSAVGWRLHLGGTAPSTVQQ